MVQYYDTLHTEERMGATKKGRGSSTYVVLYYVCSTQNQTDLLAMASFLAQKTEAAGAFFEVLHFHRCSFAFLYYYYYTARCACCAIMCRDNPHNNLKGHSCRERKGGWLVGGGLRLAGAHGIPKGLVGERATYYYYYYRVVQK